MLEIAAFGKISVGKSALLNAVFAADVFAVDVRGGSTTEAVSHVVEFGGRPVRVTDTPGFAGVDGADHAARARAAADQAHLVLAVFDHDLTQFEYAEAAALGSAGKPLLAVLNKADAFSPAARETLLQQVRGRLAAFVHPDNVLVCAADPLRFRARESDDGTVEEWAERAEPDVEAVRQRLLHVLADEGHLLQEVHGLALTARDRAASLPQARERANRLVENFALGIGVGVALNPLPLVDVFAAGAGVVVLVAQLARCYGVEMTQREMTDLAGRLVADAWRILWPSAAMLLGGQLLKVVPFVGWALGALGQASAAYYLTYVIGQACSEYFANNKRWAGSLRETLERVIAANDRKALSRRAAEQIKRRLEGA